MIGDGRRRGRRTIRAGGVHFYGGAGGVCDCAAAKPFWFDEFFPLTIAGQPNLQGMWNELRRGFDTLPPLFYLLEAVTLSILFAEPMGVLRAAGWDEALGVP